MSAEYDAGYFAAKLEAIEAKVDGHTEEARVSNEAVARSLASIADRMDKQDEKLNTQEERLDDIEDKMIFHSGVWKGIKITGAVIVGLITLNFGDVVKLFKGVM